MKISNLVPILCNMSLVSMVILGLTTISTPSKSLINTSLLAYSGLESIKNEQSAKFNHRFIRINDYLFNGKEDITALAYNQPRGDLSTLS